MEKRKSHINTQVGRDMVVKLAQHIADTEKLSNWDEVIDEFREELGRIGREKIGGAVSALVEAEDLHRLVKRAEKSRYKVCIQNDEPELVTA